MANTTFVDQSTVIVASWLNDVNGVIYNILGNGTIVPATRNDLKTNLGLQNVDNTSDLNKPVSTATQTALNGKVNRTSATGSATLPVGTTAQRDASPLAGYLRYNQTLNQFEGYNGTAWGAVGGGATGGPGNTVFFENDQTVTADYTITTAKNAMSAGPITINTGITVTVPSGSVWTIV